MTEKPVWQARPAKKEELDALLGVYNQVYKKNEDRKLLQWKYHDNPHGEAVMWVGENDSGEIVGSVAFMPRKMLVNGKECLSHHGADAMVLPEWQRQGVLITLLTQVYNQCWEMGDVMVHIFPNRRSVGALRKMGLHPVSLVQELELPLTGSYLFKRAVHKLPFLKGPADLFGSMLLGSRRFSKHRFSTQIEPISRFDDALADVAMQALADFPLALVRDRDFLNWRYIDTPKKRHRAFGAFRDSRACGYLVMETAGGRSYIADLLALDEEAREDLLTTAVKEADRAGAEMLQCMALKGDSMDRLLCKTGFEPLPDPRLVPLMINIGTAGEEHRSLFVDPVKYYVSHGDRDVEHMTC